MTISSKQVSLILLAVVFSLTFADIVTRYLMFANGHDDLVGLQRQFDLRSENNIPTWYASIALALAAALLVVISALKRNQGDHYARHWSGLGVIFLFLSLDEAASLHELLSEPIHHAFHTTGYFYYGWVIPAGLFVASVGLIYLRFLLSLPPKTRLLFLLSGAVFVGGAIGMEMLEAVEHISGGGYQSIRYAGMVAIEETMEMLGIVLFIYALASYVAVQYGRIELLFDKRTPWPEPHLTTAEYMAEKHTRRPAALRHAR